MGRLKAPLHGVTVRMYRQGHGDCFLLAFPRAEHSSESNDEPFYVLIDCGYKPGSQKFLHGKPISHIVKHLGEATGHRLDLMIITHEHQDHVNGISDAFEEFDIREVWLAWTEDPRDELANDLRRKHRDQLLGLVEARRELALAVGEEDPAVRRLDSFLQLEFGGPKASLSFKEMLSAARDPSQSKNKQAMKLIKDKASTARGVRYLGPRDAPQPLVDTAGAQAYILGPPRSEDLLTDEDPKGHEAFPDEPTGTHQLTFSAAVAAAAKPVSTQRRSPFGVQFTVPVEQALATGFFQEHYGRESDQDQEDDGIETLDNAPWRRIDAEWLYTAESLALKLNQGINNTSLVLAFELPKSKKVLLFPGDAQRGNWVSWTAQTWRDQGNEVTTRDLLARTVLYKVSHHCSHNATLAGQLEDDYPNLSWMGQGRFGSEFTALITAVEEWALTKNNPPWRHPLPSIKKALLEKAQGRVLQTDTDQPEKPHHVPEAEWRAFLEKITLDPLFFEVVVDDE